MVIGCGAVGLSAVQGARLAGATTVVAVDRNAERLDLARRLGATHAVQVPETDAVAAVRDLTGGRGADSVLEFPATRRRSACRSKPAARAGRSSGSARPASTAKSRSAGAH